MTSLYTQRTDPSSLSWAATGPSRLEKTAGESESNEISTANSSMRAVDTGTPASVSTR